MVASIVRHASAGIMVTLMTSDGRYETPVKFVESLEVSLKDWMGSDFSIAEAAWATSGNGPNEGETDAEYAERAERLIRYLMKHKHGTPFEHTAMTFVVRAPLFVWREHHRHRIGFSYNEESGRYSKLEPEFYVPNKARVQNGRPSAYDIQGGSEQQTEAVKYSIGVAADVAYTEYECLLEAGVAREVARMCLPVNIMSTCYVTCNARSLMNFIELRWQPQAQAEIRALAESYARALSDTYPMTYEAFMANGKVAP